MKTILLLFLLEMGGLLHGPAVAQAGPPPVAAEDEPTLILKPNQPNPFSEQTNIRFQLNKSGEVTVTLYNVLGSRVAVLLKENLDAGQHNYVFKKPESLPDGMYIYTVETNKVSRSQRMLIRK